VKIDVTDEVSVRAAFREATRDTPLHALIYVAGGLLGQRAQPLEEVSLDAWRRIVDVNLNGAFLCAREAVAGMKQSGTGRIVVVSSGAGLAASLTDVQSYCAAKHGEVGLVKQLGRELAPFGITVNSVAPGFIVSGPDAERQWASWTAERQQAYLATRAGKRMGTPDDIAAAIVFFASDQASWITGQTLPVTGSPL
jgi:3-oxoacyl-[acyl-carrier protein] reductase